MREIGHFVGGKEVKGTSGRFGDIFNPNTGEVQAKVALAKHSEVEHTIANAEAAQSGWASTNPQRRARVMFKFLELVQKDFENLAKLLSAEHGKVLSDARGDVQRGVEVVEFACGIPQLMKGEYTEGAGPGIDLYSMRQPLGVVAGITPFNFPAMIPASSTSSMATRKRSIRCSTIDASRRSASSAPRQSRNTSMRPAVPTASACSASAAPRTT
jgi:malonate-semialdehyde dehydrogenase (acetylating)/methylmalonate-semialdehyde dehydrogenase